jgi:PAS domain S-box-containing protein
MESREILKLVLEQLPDGLIIFDLNDDIIFANTMAEKIRHIPRNENIGQNLLNCHPEYSMEKMKRALNYLKKEKIDDFHRMIVDKENNKIYMNTYKAIRDANKKIAATIVVTRDITEKQVIEQDQLKNNQILQEQVLDLTDKLNILFLSSLTCIVNTVEFKDPYTKGHSLRVTDISKTFVEQTYGQTQLLSEIEIAGKLHDVGKIGIRDSILNKPGRLTPEEYEQMKLHPVITEQILSPMAKLKNIIATAKHHHERFDGKGYPDGLKGEEIPLGARILALADTYDAVTSARPYRQALPRERAISEIKNNLGTHYDPELGNKFIDLVNSGTIG